MSRLDERDIDWILDLASSELKAWGGDQVTPFHVGMAIARKWPEYDDRLGQAATDQMARLIDAGVLAGGTPAARAMLVDNAADRGQVLDALAALVAAHHDSLEDSSRPATEPAHADATPPQPEAASTEGDADTSPWPARSRQFAPLMSPRLGVVAREEQSREVAAELLRGQPGITVLNGARGSGLSTVAEAAVSLAMGAAPEGREFRRVDRISVGPRAASSVTQLLADAVESSVLVLDDLSELLAVDAARPDLELASALRDGLRQTRAYVVMVLDSAHRSRTEQVLGDLLSRAHTVSVPPLSETALRQVCEANLHEDIQGRLGRGVLEAALSRPTTTDKTQHPALALSRIEQAEARARLDGRQRITASDLSGAGAGSPAVTTEGLTSRLAQRVKGQDSAIDSVAKRLRLTRAKLDLRPERPDGVFLFVGPTGVGKTQLAKELAREVFGDPSRLIRLDMSEYAQEWAVSRLVGPMPGYVGSDEPEQWLTTKVAAQPESVVLLDEIEKSHPRVWNTFLQVFDAGRLTDSRGTTADFSRSVIVLTSNLGVSAASTSPLGFGDAAQHAEQARARLLATIKEHMAPELLNRMDEIVVFDALSPEAIEEIAVVELSEVLNRLALTGWQVSVSDDVAGYLATTGYDPAYGARHLQRNIERRFLAALAESTSRTVEVRVTDGQLVVSA